MSDEPLLDKSSGLAQQEPRFKSKMISALKKKLVPVIEEDPDKNEKQEVCIQIHKNVTEEEFFELLDNRDEDRAKIEKEMLYVEELYKDTGYFVEFQEMFLQEIDKNLKEAEKNSKNAASSLKKSNNMSDCILRVLYSVIGVQSVIVMVLFVLAWIF